jgi:hypothetical protein
MSQWCQYVAQCVTVSHSVTGSHFLDTSIVSVNHGFHSHTVTLVICVPSCDIGLTICPYYACVGVGVSKTGLKVCCRPKAKNVINWLRLHTYPERYFLFPCSLSQNAVKTPQFHSRLALQIQRQLTPCRPKQVFLCLCLWCSSIQATKLALHLSLNAGPAAR